MYGPLCSDLLCRHRSGCVCRILRYCIFQSVCGHRSHLTRLSGHHWSDFPKYYIIGLQWRAADWQEHLCWRHLAHTHTHACVHTCTHTDMHSELGVQGAGSRLQTHNTAPLSYCYTILRPTLTCLFPTFFSCSLRSPPIWNCRLFWELDAGQVSAAMCRTHHE